MDKTFCILIFFPHLSFFFLRSVDFLSSISSFSYSSLISSSLISLLLITDLFISVFLSGRANFGLLYVCNFSGCLFFCHLHSGPSLLQSSPLRWYKVVWQSSLLGGRNPVYSLRLYSPGRCGSPAELSGASAAVKVVRFRLFVLLRCRLSFVIRFRLVNFVLLVNQL